MAGTWLPNPTNTEPRFSLKPGYLSDENPPGATSQPSYYGTSHPRPATDRPPLRDPGEPSDTYSSLTTERQSLPGHNSGLAIRGMADMAETSNSITRSPMTPIVQGIQLISLRQALPERLRAVFSFDFFNAVQSKCFGAVYNTTDNVVVSAPTGSGKTAILELAICKLALDRGNENYKVVYLAPTKALCSEKARDWEQKFSHMSLKCAELTGDTSAAEMRRVRDASIIVTTPEKWDSITRKWHGHHRLLQMVELFLIDEVHILKDPRGATLEAVVSRMKTIGANVRFIALSATVPNSDDIAVWLGKSHTSQQLPAHRETFGEEFRPVQLEKFVYGFDVKGNDFALEQQLDDKVAPILAKHSAGKPALVFCLTRKSCESTAAMITEYISAKHLNLWPRPSHKIPVVNRELEAVVQLGVAFHHAGLDAYDRSLVEQNYLRGELSIICCTTTLAVGVNLPCHTAVLKGTIGYNNEKPQELSDLEVMQMMGRAGRPQFDTTATAVILTRLSNKARYDRMVSGQETLESTLHQSLIEHINSEVCLETIRDLQSAKTWLRGTFLSVRLRRNPNHYRMTRSSNSSSPPIFDEKLEEICEQNIKLLQRSQLITTEPRFSSTDYGRAMSRYMVEYKTMTMILQIPKAVDMEQLLVILCQTEEFREFRFKPAERALFREVNQDSLVRYPIKENASQAWHKVFLMVQAHLGQVQYETIGEGPRLKRQLLIEKKRIFEHLQRLARAVVDCKESDGDAIGTKTALELVRCLSSDSWEDCVTQLTQIPGVGPAGMRKLVGNGIRTVKQLAAMKPDEIERLMSRQPPFGKKLKNDLEKFPWLALDMELIRKGPSQSMMAEVTARVRYLNNNFPNRASNEPFLTLLAKDEKGTLVHLWRGSLTRVNKTQGLEIKFPAQLRTLNDIITCHLSCENIVGTAVTQVASLNTSSVPTTLPVGPATPATLHRPAEDYMDDNIDESDLIEAADRVDGQNEASNPARKKVTKRKRRVVESDGDSEDEAQEVDTNWKPVKLPNGKWRCNHTCSGSGQTKKGKPCSHKCCKEGTDKLRKRYKRKKRQTDANDAPDVVSVPATPLSSSPSAPDEPIEADSQPFTEPAPVNSDAGSPGFDDSDMDFVDLSVEDDEVIAGLGGNTVQSGGGSVSMGTGQAPPDADFDISLPHQPNPSEPPPITGFISKKRSTFGRDPMMRGPLDTKSGTSQRREFVDVDFMDEFISPWRPGARDEMLLQQPAVSPELLPKRLEPVSPAKEPVFPPSHGLGIFPASAYVEYPGESGAIAVRRDPGKAREGEPAWVEEFDPEVVDLLRGYVQFV
ncbi:P-loop containing nucleoside triphosphate hydrolase protein [Echria macrotheca]|uniref:DNA 3'-5' helicase n=1 Tax=Echria macrotheca TaxID=438768 RepID=A0AAJ0BKF0_9PEZI|nr:P-loop containing nucleoside triphosphate hydrolase protein [Echria macrotheca]